MCILKVTELTKSYGKRKILNSISFSVNEGEIVGFVGPNGAGKSTTMKCISGLIFPDSGKIEICGFDLAKEKEKALAGLSALIEAPGYYSNMSGLDHLKLIAAINHKNHQRIEEIIEFTGLGRSIKIPVRNYSVGMKQRLGLGMALLKNPKLLILDEPTNGLDVSGVRSLRAELKYLSSQEHISILFSSHQLSEITKLCDRIIFINNGILSDLDEYSKNKTVYRLKTSDNSKSDEILSSNDFLFSFFEEENTLELTAENDGDFARAISLLHENQIKIYDVEKKTVDLEDVYYEKIQEKE